MPTPATCDRRTTRAPPTTPVATVKGIRSAADDDSTLTEFLEHSLRVPDLALQQKPSFKVINLPSLVAGDVASLRRMMTSASETGAFLIDGWDLLRADEVRSAIEAARGVFEIGEEKRKEIGEWFGRGDEFYWGENIGVQAEVVLEDALTEEGYRIFSEKMENVATRLKTVAETILKILSENIQHKSQPTEFHRTHPVLCLRKYGNSNHSKEDITTKGHQDHVVSLFTGDCNKLSFQSVETSSSFTLPAGFILVTIGKPFEEWCNGELKAYSGELLLGSIKGHTSPISLEFMFSPSVLPYHSMMTITLMEQLLIMLAFALLCKLCF